MPPRPDTARRRPQAHRPSPRWPGGDFLEPLVRTVRESQPGTRNARLFWAACRALDVDAGQLDHHAAVDTLHDAALDVGLPEFEINRTLASTAAAGRKTAA